MAKKKVAERAWYDPRRLVDWHNSLTTAQKSTLWVVVVVVVVVIWL